MAFKPNAAQQSLIERMRAKAQSVAQSAVQNADNAQSAVQNFAEVAQATEACEAQSAQQLSAQQLSAQDEVRMQIIAESTVNSPYRDEQSPADCFDEIAYAMASVAAKEQAIAPAIKRITLTEAQQQAVDLALGGNSLCLIGAAGTGKTTTVCELITALLQMHSEGFALVAFTNRATANLRRSCERIGAEEIRREALKHCKTIHKLLAYRPAKVQYYDEGGNVAESKRFIPTYTADNPLSHIKLVVVDEASMVDLYLWRNLFRACPNARFIMIGDLNQLPPVFGDAILGYKLLEFPVVELTQVYRQAMESPIVSFQHNFTLPGILPSQSQLQALTENSKGQLTFHPLTKNYEPDMQNAVIANFFRQQYEAGLYKPVDNIILIPYNKSFGTIGLNLHIAQWLGKQRNAVVHEVIAGFKTMYFAIGDAVVYGREEYVIVDIGRNSNYRGKEPRSASTELNRFGAYGALSGKERSVNAQIESFSMEDLLNMAPEPSEDGDGKAKRQASHTLYLQSWESYSTGVAEEAIAVTSAGEIAELSFAYAITIHKSQGSEWDKVYLITTQHHATMLSRELLYTGMTRAAKELYCIYSPQSGIGKKDSSIAKAIGRPTVSGNGWREKVKYFATKQPEYEKLMAAEITEYWEVGADAPSYEYY